MPIVRFRIRSATHHAQSLNTNNSSKSSPMVMATGMTMAQPRYPTATDKHVGSRLRMRRLIMSLTQSDVADALGITFQQVQKYERGTNRISASRMAGIAELMKVRPEFFFESETG